MPKRIQTPIIETFPNQEQAKELPNADDVVKDIPQVSHIKETPENINKENSVYVDGRMVEIKPTKIKYQRNRTALAYRIFETINLVDILGMEKGIIDKTRDGDQIVFDFLVAVFDDAELVKRAYNDMTVDDIYKIVEIFRRVNKIEKEQDSKNPKAEETKA